MLMWYLSNAAMHGKNRNRGDCAQFLLRAFHKFGDGNDLGTGDGNAWGDGSPYGLGSGNATGNGGEYDEGNTPKFF